MHDGQIREAFAQKVDEAVIFFDEDPVFGSLQSEVCE